VVRTRDELSIVCSEDVCPEGHMPDGALAERGWMALKLEGPFPLSMTRRAGVVSYNRWRKPGFQSSRFRRLIQINVLTKRENLQQAVTALGAAGHENIGQTG